MKTCFKCLQSKPLSEFYRHGMMKDGHLNKCKECTKADVSASYAANREQRQRSQNENKTDEQRLERRAAGRRHRAKYPEKTRARLMVKRAVKSGKIVRQPCNVCGDPQAEAHHEDYSKPLEVVWLCFKHHREAHGQISLSGFSRPVVYGVQAGNK